MPPVDFVHPLSCMAQVGKDKNLDYDPCCLNYFSTGDFLVVGGSDRKVRVATCLVFVSCLFHFLFFVLFFPEITQAFLACDRQASLYTREGVRLHTICDQDGWVWSCAVRYESSPTTRTLSLGLVFDVLRCSPYT